MLVERYMRHCSEGQVRLQPPVLAKRLGEHRLEVLQELASDLS